MIRTAGTAYWILFAASFLAIAVWESFRPVLVLSESAQRRWTRHSLLFIVAAIITTVIIPLNPVLLAASLEGSHYGLLSRPWLPLGVRWVLAVLIIDLVKYASHRALHSVRFLWRVHEIHHSDRDLDVSTAVRAHPVEVLFFQATNVLTIAALAPPPLAVLVAQLLSVFESFFSHANSLLPERWQAVLGWIIYSSNTHRGHHTVDMHLQNTNFGDIFPWWDMLFGTYSAPLGAGRTIAFGVAEDQSGPHPGAVLLLKRPLVPGPRNAVMAQQTGSN